MNSAKIRLSSPAFADGQPIPKRHTGEGEDLSPPLAWSELPEGTRELVLICDDPNAPAAEPWVHWVLYKIAPDVAGLPEGITKEKRPAQPPGAVQGRNSWTTGQTIGYRGPMPPVGHGVHRYYFRLYALNTRLTVESGLTKKAILNEMGRHILGEGQLMGTYQR
ncbi:MAG: YbhB/YbcL family Raf kinase inhibitor-like protein [Thermoguttaceae bacterium]